MTARRFVSFGALAALALAAGPGMAQAQGGPRPAVHALHAAASGRQASPMRLRRRPMPHPPTPHLPMTTRAIRKSGSAGFADCRRRAATTAWAAQ